MLLEAFTQQQPVIAPCHTTLVLARCVNGGYVGFAMRPVSGTPFGDGYRNSTDETTRIVMVALRTQWRKIIAPSMSIDEAGMWRRIVWCEETRATWGTCVTLDCEAVETPPAV